MYTLVLAMVLWYLTIGSHSASAQTDPDTCQDPGGVDSITSGCWTALGINQYITDWFSTSSSKCMVGTPFATCFLQVLDIGTLDCVGITSNTCGPPDWKTFKTSNIDVKAFYVVYKIYTVREFFNSYWTAIGNANGVATNNIAAIVGYLDPPQKSNGNLNDVLTALSVGLSLIAPESQIASSLLGGLQQAPAVAKYLFPIGTLNSQFQQFGQISQSMGKVIQSLQDNIATALATVQNDHTTFLAFTGQGQFSYFPVPTMSDQSHTLVTALNTYVVAQALKANDWTIARAIDTDVHALFTNGSYYNWYITGCNLAGSGYDANSICGPYYYDASGFRSFTLTNNANLHSDPAPVMQKIFTDWTTPQLIFNGAAQCQVEGGSSPVVSITGSTVNVPCLSDVQVCTWNLDGGRDTGDVADEFTDCPNQNDYVSGENYRDCVYVPVSYVGAYMISTTTFGDGKHVGYCSD